MACEALNKQRCDKKLEATKALVDSLIPQSRIGPGSPKKRAGELRKRDPTRRRGFIIGLGHKRAAKREADAAQGPSVGFAQ